MVFEPMQGGSNIILKVFFWGGNHVYPNYNDPQRQESRRPVQAGTLQFQAGPDCSDLRSRRRCRRSRNADSEIVGC